MTPLTQTMPDRSTASAPDHAAVHPRARRPELRVVERPRLAAPRAPFVAVVLVLLGGGLVSLLLLNTALAQGAFTLRDLQRTNLALTQQQQSLSQQLAAEQQPAALARRARALGMVPAGTPAFLHLPKGTIAGDPHVATTPAPPKPAATPSATPAPARSPAAKPSAKAGKHAATPAPAHRPATTKPTTTKSHPTAGTRRTTKP